MKSQALASEVEKQNDIKQACEEPECFTIVLVDTSAFIKANNDFLGLYSSTLPSFFDAVTEKGLALLSHPILENEIRKHIDDSSYYKNYQKLITQIKRCENALDMAECYDEELFKRIVSFDIKSKAYETFTHNYSEAIRLCYSDPEIVFEKYFSSEPPFSETGNKKHEFPDAFVIESVCQYLMEHPYEILLVVSNDCDWEKAFSKMENVMVSKSIDDAIIRINKIKSVLNEEFIAELFKSAYNEMVDNAQFYAECECYTIADYEFVEDFEVDRIEVIGIDDLIVPLKITRNSLLFKTTITISIDGHGVVLDEYSSIWDKEDGVYVYTVYADLSVTEGKAEVECEVELEFGIDDPEGTVQVSRMKLNNRFDIEVIGGREKLTVINPEVDYYGEMMDALEEYYHH